MKRLPLLCIAVLVLIAFGQSANPYARAAYFETVETAEWSIAVRGIERRSDPLPATGSSAEVRANGQFVVLLIDLTNHSTIARTPATNDFRLIGRGTTRSTNLSETAAASALAVARGYAPFSDAVARGATVETILVFDLTVPGAAIDLAIPAARTIVELDECHCNLPAPARPVIPWPTPD